MPKKNGGYGLNGSFAKYFYDIIFLRYYEPNPPIVLLKSLYFGYFSRLNSTTHGTTIYWLKSYIPLEAALFIYVRYCKFDIYLFCHLSVILLSNILYYMKLSRKSGILFNLYNFNEIDFYFCIFYIYLRNYYLSLFIKLNIIDLPSFIWIYNA